MAFGLSSSNSRILYEVFNMGLIIGLLLVCVNYYVYPQSDVGKIAALLGGLFMFYLIFARLTFLSS
jgi:hypothetical protein